MAEATLITAQIELDRAWEESRDRPVVIFKHSPRCSVSAYAFGGFRDFVEGIPEDDAALFTVVDVLEARAVSDETARRTGIRHESPQAIVLRHGKVVWSGSHWDISEEALTRALADARD